MSDFLARTCHFSDVVHDHQLLLDRAIACLTDVEFDTIVVNGLSGVLAAPIIARYFDAHVFVLRKPFEFSHSRFAEEGYLGKRWVFVDDIFHSGSTFRKSHKRIEELSHENNHETEFVGVFLHSRYDDRGKFYPPGDPLLCQFIAGVTPYT